MNKSSSKGPNQERAEPLASQALQEKGKNLAMRLGERLNIEIQSTGERLWGELVGFKAEVFLLVWLPSFLHHRLALAADNTVTVRGMNKDFQLCGFRTTIIKTLLTPAPLLFLKFPDLFEIIFLRRHDRVGCLLPAVVRKDGREQKSMIINLSLGGARIVLDQHNSQDSMDAVKGQEITLFFSLIDGGAELTAKAVVHQIYDFEGKFSLGLEFVELIGDSKTRINEYIASIQAYSSMQ